MKDKDIHKYIEDQEPEEKAALFQRVMGNLDVANEPIRNKKKRRVFAYTFSAVALVCLCLIIILPILLKDKEPDYRYRESDSCVYQLVDYNVKEYAQSNNLDMLYINWYDIAEEYTTLLYSDKDDLNEIIYIEEDLVNIEDEVIAILYIMDIYTEVDVIKTKFANLDLSYDYNGVNIFYINNYNIESFAYFQYNNYSYYIWLQNMSIEPYDEQLILNIAEGMLAQ